MSDCRGVLTHERNEGMNSENVRYAQETSARTLGDVIHDADIFLGLSAGGVLKPDMVQRMAPPG